MLTWFLIYVLPGSVVFGVAAWLWRYRLNRPRAHLLLVLVASVVAWLASMLFGWFLYLDVLHAGPLGRALNASVVWSAVPAWLTYYILRKHVEPPLPANTSTSYFSR